ncbi:MAG: ParB/RepB/Spo0J family partition protein [Clostridia bacterium]|nr:ParB/RepB/Spo0J family partition protein [Clostridia bacterium]
MVKRGLGKGLGALIPTPEVVEYNPEQDVVLEISVEEIIPNSFQPRKEFDPEKLQELASSIQEHGVIQPVIVRPRLNNTGYELVVGERRLRACKMIGLEKIPAVIKTLSDQEMTEIALIENIQRENLNPVEEAKAYKRLIEEFGLTQEEVAKKVGKSRPFVANFLRLLQLPSDILDLLADGKVTVGHVRPLLSLVNESLQRQVVKEILEKNLSVRETEETVKKIIKDKTSKRILKKKNTSPVFLDLQEQLQNKFGTKVLIKDSGKRGKIEIEYYNYDDLQRIIDMIVGQQI